MCRQEPWSDTFKFETRGFTRGAYAGTFILKPSEPRVLLLSPRTVNFDFSVAEGLRVLIPELLEFGPTGFRG